MAFEVTGTSAPVDGRTVVLEVIEMARRIAHVRARPRASHEDVRLALTAVAEDARFADALRPRLATDDPGISEELRASLAVAQAPGQAPPKVELEEGLLNLLGRLAQSEPTLETVVASLIALHSTTAHGPAAPPPAGVTLSQLKDHYHRAARLEQALQGIALGRRAAIAAFASGYFESLAAPAPQGPRGVFTLVGLSGSGKTFLAESFSRALEEVEGIPHPLLHLDLAAYSSPQSAEQLFGVAEFYSGSTPGTLTKFVRDHPRCVVLLDGIEKAHRRTLEALLSIFDQGEALDVSLSESVSFREAWVLCTTSIDEERLASANRTGVLAAIGASPTALLDTLIPRLGAREAAAGDSTAIPTSLISRLARGTAVLCGPLETNELGDLARQTLASIGPPIEIDDDAVMLFLLSLLPELDVRRVAARARAWGLDLLRRVVAEDAIRLGVGPDVPVTLRVTCGTDALDFLAGVRRKQSVRVFLVDDGEVIERRLRSETTAGTVQIERASTPDKVSESLLRRRFDLALLDLTIDVDAKSAAIDKGLEILEVLRRLRPDLPVHLFSEQPSERGAFEEIAERVLRRGGARSFIPCQRDDDNLPDAAFVEKSMAAIERQRDDLVARDLERRRRTVTFRVQIRPEEAGTKLVAEIRAPRKEHLLDPPPSSSPVEYLGIPLTKFADVVGLDRAKERLREAVGWLKDPALLVSTGARPPRGFLLAGRPGTGKTLLARALAGETETPLVAVSAGALQSRYSGESEARVRELFAKAQRHAPTIVFIDEIDSIAGARDRDVRESHGLLNQLLSSIDGVRPWEVPILVLGATNLPGQVDPALTRPGRLDEVLQIDLPNANARRNLLESRLRSLDPGVDLQAVAIDTTGCTPAEIDRIAREAIYRSLSEKRATVSSSDLDHARRLVLLGLGATDLEVTEDERRLAAFHEAGHVVAFRELFPDRRIDFVSILPSEQGAIGAVLSSRRRERSPAAEDVRKELVVLLAGRAAEALSGLPAPTAAAATDLEQATALVQRAVGEWGFDEEIGPVHLDRSRAPQPQLNASWQRVRSWLVEADERAKKLVTDRLGEVATVAERLRAEESLDGRAIGELLRNLAE